MEMRRYKTVIALLSGLAGLGLYNSVGEALGASAGKPAASDWVQAHHTRVRLIAGQYLNDEKKLKLQAGIHIELDPGWKTYWRTPGGAGGVAPYFDWQRSVNLKSAEVLFPAPARIAGEDGVSIGYKGAVVFPVKIEAVDPGKPVQLALRLDYGVCKDICVPVQAALDISVDKVRQGRGSFGRVDAQLIERYLVKVPKQEANSGADVPLLKSVQVNLQGAHPVLNVDAEFPSGIDGADLFVEAPDGLYVALPTAKRLGETNVMRFTIDLSKGEDPALFRGKELMMTLVSEHGQSVALWRVPLN